MNLKNLGNAAYVTIRIINNTKITILIIIIVVDVILLFFSTFSASCITFSAFYYYGSVSLILFIKKNIIAQL